MENHRPILNPTDPVRAPKNGPRWLNGTVLGIGLASLFSDWSHEIATTVMPAFLATMGVAVRRAATQDGTIEFDKSARGGKGILTCQQCSEQINSVS